MSTITQTKYHSNMIDIALNNIHKILNIFDIKYYQNNNKKIITGCCPIHQNSDNENALYLRLDSGIWKCYTHHCEQIFGKSILGLVKGLISTHYHQWSEDNTNICSFKEVISFLNKLDTIKKSTLPCTDKTKFIKSINHTTNNILNTNLKISRNIILTSLRIPSQYFLNRGFLSETLIKYDVGDCMNNNKEMKNRAVVPIYDNNYEYIIGCSGRSIYEKCLVCGYHHAEHELCPQKYFYQYSKWLHNHNFNKENVLYNYWFAKNEILKTNKIIIVESPGNVWKLHEAGMKNMVAILGCSLSKNQLNLIHQSGALEIVLLLDNDEAGHTTKEFLKQYLTKMSYKITTPTIYTNDIAEMKLEDIKKCLV